MQVANLLRSQDIILPDPSLASRLRFSLKLAVGAFALRLMAQVGYSLLVSPSQNSFDVNASRFTQFYNDHLHSCEDTGFKVTQLFFNSFESFHVLPRAAGFNAELPFGDLVGFIFTENMKGLDCAYNSYPKESITLQMKNKLLGQVMQAIHFEQRRLAPFVDWLIDKGADPNYQHPIDKKNRIEEQESTLSPLLLAFRLNKFKLFHKLLAKGAKVQNVVYTFSKETERWDIKTPIISQLALEMIHSHANASKEKCEKLSKLMRAAISSLPDYEPFLDMNRLQFTAFVHSMIRPSLCRRYFEVQPDHLSQAEIDNDDFDSIWAKLKVGDRFFRKLFERFTNFFTSDNTDQSQNIDAEAQKEQIILKAYEYLGLDRPTTLAKVQSAYRELSKTHHPDRGGTDQQFIYLTDQLQIVKNDMAESNGGQS